MTRLSGLAVLLWGMLSGGIWLTQSRLSVDVTRYEELARIGIGQVTDIVISPDSASLAVTTMTGVYLYDLETLSPGEPHLVHDGWSSKAAWSPDGTQLALSSGGDFYIWDRMARQETLVFASQGGVTGASIYHIAWSPDGARIGAEGLNRLNDWFLVWAVDDTSTLQRRLVREQGTSNLFWSPDGHFVLGITPTGSIEVQDTDTDRTIYRSVSLGNMWAAFSPDSTRIALGGTEGALQIVDTANWETRLHVPELASTFVTKGVWSPDGTRLAVWVGSQSLQIVDANSGDVIREIYANAPGVPSYFLAWSADGKHLVTDIDSRKLVVWDTDSWQRKAEMYTEVTDYDYRAAYSRDGTRLAVSNGDGTLQVWDIIQQTLLWTANTDGALRSLAWSPDGGRILATNVAQLFLWDAERGEPLAEFPKLQNWVYDVEWSPQGIALSGGRDIMLLTELTDTQADDALRLDVLKNAPQSLSWSPDGTRLAALSLDGLELWNSVDDTLLWADNAITVEAQPRWSPDGQYILTPAPDGRGVAIWDAQTGEYHVFASRPETPISPLPLVASYAWSPDGTYIASGYHRGGIVIQFTFNGQWRDNTPLVFLRHQPEASNLGGSRFAIPDLYWIPDDDRLVSISHDGTVRIWGIPDTLGN